MIEITVAGRQIAALAGRRVDAAHAKNVVFPLDHIGLVESQLRKRFAEDSVGLLICSAACGADLVALKTASLVGIERIIVLPFSAERFRDTSVSDRPGDWTPLYDQQIRDARRKKQLIVLDGAQDDADAYRAATKRIVAEIVKRCGSVGGVAYAVWEGKARSDHDETAEFRRECVAASIRLYDINTTDG